MSDGKSERIDQVIAGAKAEYLAAVGVEPDRVYLGVVEAAELGRLVDLYNAAHDEPKPHDEVQGLRVFKVRVNRHCYVAGGI